MDSDKALLVDADLTDWVIGAFYAVYNELGSGFVESVYENALALALRQIGLDVQQQACFIVRFRNQVVGEFRIDLHSGKPTCHRAESRRATGHGA